VGFIGSAGVLLAVVGDLRLWLGNCHFEIDLRGFVVSFWGLWAISGFHANRLGFDASLVG
jgi:hypothetical protein